MLTLQEKLDIIEKTNSLGELPLDAMPYTQSDEYYFVSYSHADYKRVYSDILKLQALGINVWYDRGLPAGKNWEDMAEEALSKYSCVGVIFYISKNSLLSDAVAREIAYVKNLGKDFLSVNLPIELEDGSTKICSAQQMLSVIEKENPISESKRAEVCSAFNDKVIYLGYNESTEVKAEKIKLLKKPELFEYEITEHEYDEDFSLSVVTLKSVNSIDIKRAEIPKRVMFGGEERTVMKIGDCAFANCKHLKSVKIPEDITIGKSAFLGCTSLERVESERISEIDDNAFFGCSSLKELPILDSWVKSNAFFGCTSLKEITLGNGFHSCGPNLFAGSGINRVTREEYDDSYMQPRSYSFSCMMHELVTTDDPASSNWKGEKLLLYGCPDSDGDFRHIHGVKKIIGGFLPDAKALKTLEVGGGVHTLDSYALYRCENLTEVTFAEGEADSLYINEKAFCKSLSLKELTLPKRTKYIGVSAFERSAVESLKFEDGAELSQIDDNAFRNCKNLAKIEFTTVGRIGRSAFEKCGSLERIELPSGLKIIDGKAFMGCDSLCEVSFPEGLTEIADNAFCGDGNLTEIRLPSSLKRIGDNAFYQCRSLKSVILPEGLLEIGINAFYHTGIKEITLPASLEKMSLNGFEKIRFMGTAERWQELLIANRRKCEFPVECIDGVYDANTVIKGSLRYELNSDGLGYTVSGIGSYIAAHLAVPESYNGLPVTKIAGGAFADAPISSISFDGSIEIDKRAFSGALHLKSADLTNVNKLAEEAFFWASSLESVNLGSRIEEIPDKCFMSCSSLRAIHIGANVKRIGESAFGSCDDLADVYIENGVELIGDFAFSFCESLRYVFIPSSVKRMGDSAGKVFFDCPSSLVIDCEADSQPESWAGDWAKTMNVEATDTAFVEYKVNFGKRRGED